MKCSGLGPGAFFVCKGFQKGSRLNCINFFVIINIYAHASGEAERTIFLLQTPIC